MVRKMDGQGCASLVVIPFIVLELCYIDKFYNFFQRLAVEVEELYDSFMSENRSFTTYILIVSAD
jgi:hypothetical protein